MSIGIASSPGKNSSVKRRQYFRVPASLLVLLSAIMIIVAKVDQVAFERLRIPLTDGVEPLLDMFSRPLTAIRDLADRGQRIIDVYQDNRRLADENKRLLRWQQAALSLAAENAQLRDLLRLTPDPAAAYVTARVIADSGGAFLRGLLVNAGSEAGIASGQAAVTGDGLAGRVYEVGTRTARILLITDLNSRVPVVVERTRQRAILAGDNSQLPSLLYLDPSTPVTSGDRIVTSGTAGVFPPGLPVGVVDVVDRGPPRVAPYVRLSQVEYVRIIDNGVSLGPSARAAATLPGERHPQPVPAVATNRQ
jgi:rod shape-determining protein MreC